MLRFCGKDFSHTDDIQIILADQSVSFGQNMWKMAREYFKCSVCDDVGIIHLLPVTDETGSIICYAYQDWEANRELRMLKELEKMKGTMQFEDIFPNIHKVIILGCNELAYHFAKYMESRQITVFVMGKYWSDLGYAEKFPNDVSDDGALVIYADEIFQSIKLDQMVIRSVSPRFECIDKIYEENVKKGLIGDTEGSVETFWKGLNGQKIVILGTSLKGQDTYDVLCEHGVDIAAFVEEQKDKHRDKNRTLLGKKVIGLEQALALWENAVFIDCIGRNSALGSRYLELLDYFGYERNKQLFFINDYTVVPFSNLVHVMNGKKVLLTGDERLCELLSEYLDLVENGNVEVQYISLGQKVLWGEECIRCLVIPHSRNQRKGVDIENTSRRNKFLSDMGFDNYTEYFMRHRAFVLIERYLNGSNEKYTVPEITPKGILLGRIPSYSGNFFFRGILDGHLEILMMPYSDLNNNLFYYCIRLAGVEAGEILQKFWEMYDEEASSREMFFTDVEKFEKSFKRLLGLKKIFTSQELFMMFHIAYLEMLSEKQFVNISELVIYWEPHYISRDEFPFLALWLEDKKINGQTVRLRRNNIVRTGSACERAATGRDYTKTFMFDVMFLEDVDNDILGQRCLCRYWREHKLRFEDIKVYPKEELLNVCEWLGISWSDSMMETTRLGEVQSYRGSANFDLQPVFKKSEKFLSEFDRFRISIACSPYQKKYGYTYDDCTRFSRRELQEMFLKSFFFEEQEIFVFKNRDYMRIREQMSWNLWDVRKHMVLGDICPEFERFELKQTGGK